MSRLSRLFQPRRRVPGGAPPVPFVDVHCHLLPGVDDGATDLRETLAMLQLARHAGTGRIVATPHLFHPLFPPRGATEIREIFAGLSARLADLQEEPGFAFLREIEVGLGAEHHVSTELLNALTSGDVLPLAGGRHLLVEFPDLFPFEAMAGAARQVLAAGWVPVLAHVERYAALRADLRHLAGLLEMGCLAQVNGGSLLPSSGRAQRKLCHELLRRGLVHVVASDGHRSGQRRPELRRAWEHLRQSYPGERVSAWMAENPAAILAPAAGEEG